MDEKRQAADEQRRRVRDEYEELQDAGALLITPDHPEGIRAADLYWERKEQGKLPPLPPPGYVLVYDRDHPEGVLRPAPTGGEE